MAKILGLHGGYVETGPILTLSYKGLGCKVKVTEELKKALTKRETYGHEDFVMSFPKPSLVYLSFGSALIVVSYSDLFSKVI